MGRKNARAASTRAPFSASSSGVGKRKQRTREPKEAVEIDDAYTFDEKLPKRHRTGEQQLSLTREEAQPERPRPGNESDEDEDMAARIRRVAMQIAGDDGAEVEESDDEDIDSDEAWEEDGSDEERWGDVFRDLKKGKGKKGKEVVMKVS
jgi:U3 small nucleolar RNA-associated protein 14